MNRPPGYGVDGHCAHAQELIREACEDPLANVLFCYRRNSCQRNRYCIAFETLSRGASAAKSGHINVHEAGAVEATGHKVIGLDGKDGKLSADTLRDYLESYWADPTHEHVVQPGMVYISSPTELGTVYSKSELQALSEVCREFVIPLYLDGARLGYGLQSPGNDVTLEDIDRLTDVFYIGGTKVGILMGEAIVFPERKRLGRKLPKHD